MARQDVRNLPLKDPDENFGHQRDDSDINLDKEIMRALATDGQLRTVDPEGRRSFPLDAAKLIERVQARRGRGWCQHDEWRSFVHRDGQIWWFSQGTFQFSFIFFPLHDVQKLGVQVILGMIFICAMVRTEGLPSDWEWLSTKKEEQ